MSLVALIISKFLKKYYTAHSRSFKITFKWWTLEITRVAEHNSWTQIIKKNNTGFVLKAFCVCCNSPEVERVYISSSLNRLKGRPIEVSWFVQLAGATGKRI